MGGSPKKVVKKVVKPIKKVVKKVQKVVPKEVKPILPAVAAIYGPAALSATKFGAASGFASLAPGVQSAIINAATQGAVSGKIDPKEAAISGITAQLGAKAKLPKGPVDTGGLPTETILSTSSKTLQPMATATQAAKAAEIAKQQTPFLQRTLSNLAPVDLKETIANEGIMSAVKQGARAAAPAATYAVGRELKELNEQMIRDYEASLNKGVDSEVGPDGQIGAPIDKDTRRSMIFGYFTNAGYEPGYVNTILDKYGYADGGRVGFEEGGQVTISREEYESLKRKAGEGEGEGIASIDVKDLGDLQESLGGIMSGYQMATGQSLVPQPARIPTGIVPGFGNMPRVGRAEGGMMNLGNKEMDMRDGGFIPIGAKEKADDVPARLSKNEFVMTADAVRGAGNGSVERGAKRMYDLMNKLETKV